MSEHLPRLLRLATVLAFATAALACGEESSSDLKVPTSKAGASTPVASSSTDAGAAPISTEPTDPTDGDDAGSLDDDASTSTAESDASAPTTDGGTTTTTTTSTCATPVCYAALGACGCSAKGSNGKRYELVCGPGGNCVCNGGGDLPRVKKTAAACASQAIATANFAAICGCN